MRRARRHSSSRTGAVGIAVAALGLLCGSGAGAQTLAAPENFTESFVGETDTAVLAAPAPGTQSGGGAGRLLSGLRLGEPAASAKADPSRLRVLLPDASAGARLCVQMTTVDNRYSAESAHRLDPAAAGAPALGLPTAYGDALAAYGASDLLVTARRAADCGVENAGVLAPAMAQDAPGALIVSVNIGRGRPTAQLWRDGVALGDPAACRKDEQAAKSHDCSVSIAGLSGGVYELRIVSAAVTGGGVEESYAVALP